MHGSDLLFLSPDDVGLKVEIAFNAGYATAAADRVWTDVTEYVLIVRQSVEIRHGRSDEFSTADANSCSLLLKNIDGRFTPGKTTGAYYPNVKIGRPLRVSKMTETGHTSVRFVGFIDEWRVEWPAVVDTFATTAVTAYSRMARLGSTTSLRSLPEEETRRLVPVVYYTLGEAEGATSAADSMGDVSAQLIQAGTGSAVTFGTATGPPTDDLTAASFHLGKRLSAALPVAIPANGMSAVVAFNTAALTTDERTVLELPMTGGGVWIETDSFVGVRVGGWRLGGGGSLLVHGSTASISANTTYVAAVTTSTGSLMTSYLNGVSIGTDGSWSLVTGSATALHVGGSGSLLATLASPDQFEGAVAHVAIFAVELTAAEVAVVSEAMLSGFLGEAPGDRLERYASYAGIPAAEVNADTGVTTLAHFDTTGMNVIEAMRRVEESESGVLYDGRDGRLTFHDRDRRYTASVGLTLDASGSQVQADYAPNLDRSAVVNIARVSNLSGTVSADADDTASRDDLGDHSTSVETASDDDEEPFQRAWWLVNTYAEPRLRAPQVSVEAVALSQTDQQSVLGADVGTRVDLTNLPSQAEASSASYFVEGYSESIGPTTHRITFNLSPAEPYLSVWTLDSATLSQLDTSTRLAY